MGYRQPPPSPLSWTNFRKRREKTSSRTRSIPQILDKGLGWCKAGSLLQFPGKDPSWSVAKIITQPPDRDQGWNRTGSILQLLINCLRGSGAKNIPQPPDKNLDWSRSTSIPQPQGKGLGWRGPGAFLSHWIKIWACTRLEVSCSFQKRVQAGVGLGASHSLWIKIWTLKGPGAFPKSQK